MVKRDKRLLKFNVSSLIPDLEGRSFFTDYVIIVVSRPPKRLKPTESFSPSSDLSSESDHLKSTTPRLLLKFPLKPKEYNFITNI